MVSHSDKRCLSFTWLLLIAVQCIVVTGIPCPHACQCSLYGINFFVDCSGLELTELPEFDDAVEINWLDLSNNYFTEIPSDLTKFNSLESLDMSGNRISQLSATSLVGFNSLKTLTLSKNNITNWLDINPNEILLHAPVIATLHLNENPLTSFSSTDEKLVLISESLRNLDIRDCKITKVNGNGMLMGMSKLEYLDLSGNPIRTVTNIISETLIGLNLANCRLASIPSDALANMPSLTQINFSRNHRIDLASNPDEFVKSNSLKRIDLSYCNMDSVELAGFPQLKTAILRGNMIRELNQNSFIYNELLEILDLNSNSIIQVTPNSMQSLKQLKTLDLSFNTIQRIERETFKDNEKLTTVNLSRNYISRFSRIVSTSIASLNLSSCEIMTIDSDALIGMPSLSEIDLSHNLLSSFPDSMISDSLQSLDLRTCRISSVRNTTFMNLPELSRLRLSGNRLTTPFRVDFFNENPYLAELWLGDNPWRCDCRNEDFLQFYRFITEKPAKVYDRNHLRCGSPEEVYGSHWEVACFHIWYPNERPMGTAEKVWTIVLVGLFVFAGSLCLLMTIKKCIEGRKLTRTERERQRYLEEQRDIMRQNRMAMEQQAQLNAPDPRESHPPCYEDALKLPRLDGSFASLNELSIKREKKRGANAATNIITEELALSRRSRCRSEDNLAPEVAFNRRSRHYRAPSQINPSFDDPQYANISIARRHPRIRVPTSPPPTRVPTPPPSTPLLPPPPPLPSLPLPAFPKLDNELHYHSIEILNLPDHFSSTPSSTIITNPSPVPGDFDNLEDFSTSRDSPYSRRRSRSNLCTDHTKDVEIIKPEEIIVVEDHFGAKSKQAAPKRTESDDDTDSSFSTFTDLNERSKSSSPELINNQSHSVQVHRDHHQPTESDL